MTVHTWNYRVLRHGEGDEITYAIHEVHYEDGVPKSCSSEPAAVAAEDLVGLWETLELMSSAATKNKPVLNYEDFGKP
jgi:hypothetical protein